MSNVICDECKGKRYNSETTFGSTGKKYFRYSFHDRLDEYFGVFSNIPAIKRKLQNNCRCWIGYSSLAKLQQL